MKKGESVSKIFEVALVFVIMASTLGGLAWASESDVVGTGYVDVSVEQAKGMIDSDPDLSVLDVRTENEYEAGHIAGAELMPLSELEQRAGELEKDDALLVYCKSGTKSVEASNILIQHEFESVYNMEGGINAWVNAGYPVVYPSNNLLSSEIDASLDAGKPVFLFLHADWCHFCQEEMPIIEELELEYAEQIVVIYVNNEDNPEAMTEFGVTGFPAMFLISSKGSDGEYRYQEFMGFTDKETLSRSFDQVITNGNTSEGSGVDSDTRCEETVAVTAGTFSQDLCVQALAAEACPEHCECLTDEEAEEQGLTLCNGELIECMVSESLVAAPVWGHCYQMEEELALCPGRNIDLIRQHLDGGNIKFIAIVACPIARLEMIIGGSKVTECDGSYCDYYGGPYQPGEVPDFAVTLYDDLNNATTFESLVVVDVNVTDDILGFDFAMGLCNYCPDPEAGWGKLLDCTCEGNENFQPYDLASYIQVASCIYENFNLTWGPCTLATQGGFECKAISGPIYDYCINDDYIRVHVCQNGKCVVGRYFCPYGCSHGQCICSDTDGGIDYYEKGSIGWATDECTDEDWVLEYYTVLDEDDQSCHLKSISKQCPGGCDDGKCVGNCYDGIQNGDEQGVDCGPSCPADCIDCFDDAAPGDAEDEGYFKLETDTVYTRAQVALVQYADCLRNETCRKTLNTHAYNLDMNFSTVTANDLAQSTDYIMEAVAYYVDKHTTYMFDTDCDICDSTPGADLGPTGAINAKDMILKSGGRSGCISHDSSSETCDEHVDTCPSDYCGDCEDHAILREALMRVLGVSWKCAFCADHYNNYWGTDGHTFNLVYYRNRWRIMDYDPLGNDFSISAKDSSHAPQNIWNDHFGEFWCSDWRSDPPACWYCCKKNPYSKTQNYNGHDIDPTKECFSGSQDTYYIENCP